MATPAPIIRTACAATAIFTLMLAGCGGGGGSSSPAPAAITPVVAASTIGSSAAAPVASQTGKALLVYIPNASNVSVTDSSAASGTAMTLNQSFTAGTAGGATSQGSANFSGTLTGGTTILGTGVANRSAIDSTTLQIIPGTAPLQSYETPAGGTANSIVVASRYANQSGTVLLNDSSYGLLGVGGTTGNIAFGGYHAGNATAVAQLPVTGSYTGVFAGFDLKPGTSAAGFGAIDGDVKLNADFSKGTVSGNVTNITNVSSAGVTSAAGYGLSLNGTIAGNAYTGTTAFTNATPGGPAATTATSSALNGAFYGANASETAGALRVQGLAPKSGGGTVDTVVIGAFGAKK
jgi:C-lobe and N-lobe beta barrels of Tf-binding protein B